MWYNNIELVIVKPLFFNLEAIIVAPTMIFTGNSTFMLLCVVHFDIIPSLNVCEEEIMSEVCLVWTKHTFQNFEETLDTVAKCYEKEPLGCWPTTAVGSLRNIWKWLADEFCVCSILATDQPCSFDMAQPIQVSKRFAVSTGSSNHILQCWLRCFPQNWIVKGKELHKCKCATFRTDLSFCCGQSWNQDLPG